MDETQFPVAGVGEAGAPPTAEVQELGPTVEQRFLEHFGLSEQPFGVTPDPRFLYLGPKHRQALAALNYGTELNRGFLTLIGQPGLGKTSLLFNYLEGLRNKARTVFLFRTDCDARELMSYILADLGLDATGKDLPEMHSILNQVLTEEMRVGRRFVLVIDEAQNLTEKVLESVRLLSNFETPWMKLMQIVLAGQPQLSEHLANPSMAQLQQRISLAIQIEPLSSEEVSAYVDHRLWVANYQGSSLFSVGARALLAEYSEGIPRKINNICFCAMSLAWATKQKTIDRDMMREVLTNMNLAPSSAKTDLPEKTEEAPKRSVVQSVRPPVVRPPVLTVHEPSSRRLSKLVLTCTALLALGWSGFHFGFGKRVMVLWHGLSTTEKGSVVTAPSPLSLGSSVSASPGNFSANPNSEALTGDKDADEPQQSGGQTTPSSREPN